MISGPVTSRYAEALFRLAQRRGELDAVDADVRRIAAELESAHVAGFLFDARVDPGERRAKLEPLLRGLSSQLTRNFVNLLFDKRREEVLRGLGAAWHRRSLEERGAVEGLVESARPLPDSELARLRASLGKTLSKEVQLENRVVPELVAGVRVTVGGRMIDASVQGRLEDLRKQLLEAPLSSARD